MAESILETSPHAALALQKVRDNLKAMEAKLLELDPALPGHLAAIHTELIQYEELAHLLSDEEIQTLFAAQKKHSGVQLTSAAITKTAAVKKVPRGTSIANDL